MELLVFLTFSCLIGCQGLLIIAVDFTLLRREHLKSSVDECMRCFAPSFLPLLTLDIADSDIKKTKAQWVSNGLHRYRLRETGPNVKMHWLQTLVSFSSVMLLWPLKWHHLYFPACLNGGANRPLLLYFFCAVHKLLRTINLPSAFRLSV